MLSLDDDFALVKSPLDTKYVKVLKFALSIVAAWDVRYIEGINSKYTTLKKIYITLLEYACLVAGACYLKTNYGVLPFIELGHTCITVFMNIVACTRLLLIFIDSYHELILRFLNKIHLYNFKDVSQHAMKVHLMVHKLSHYFTLYLSVLTVTGYALFHGIPLYNNIKSGAFNNPRPKNVTFQHTVYYQLPFDYKTNFWGYLALSVCNIYITCIATLCFIAFDLLISLLIFHIWGHLKILVHNLEVIPLPLCSNSDGESYTYSKYENVDIFNRLRECVIHHQLVIDFISAISHTFGVFMLIYYAFHQVCLCFLLLQCSQMNAAALSRYGPLTLILFQQLIQISVVFELLGSSYETLSFAVYNTPWEYMDTKNRKLVLIFLRQAQKPVNLKAGSMVTVGVQTMATILKTSISYFVLLQTFALDDSSA